MRNSILSLALAVATMVSMSCSSGGDDGGGDGQKTALSFDSDTALPAAGGAAIAAALGTRLAAITGSVLSALSSAAAASSSSVSPKADIPLDICMMGSANVVGDLVPGTTATLTLDRCIGSPLSSTEVNGRIRLEIATVDSWITGTAAITGPEAGGDFTIAPDTVLSGSFAVQANFVPGFTAVNLYLGDELDSDLIALSEAGRDLQLGCFEIYTRIGLVAPVIEFFQPLGVLSLDAQVYTLNSYAGGVPNIGFESTGTARPNAGSLVLYSGDNRLSDAGETAPCFGRALAGDSSIATATFRPEGLVEVDVESSAGECSGCQTTWENLLNTLNEIIDTCEPATCDGTGGTGGTPGFPIRENPSSGPDNATSIVVEGDYIYVAGSDSVPGNSQWRIEKRDKSTGALVAAFNSGGVIQSNPGIGEDSALAIALDGPHLYIVGSDTEPGQVQFQWRVEKRNKSDGALVTAFAQDGVVQSDPSEDSDVARAIVVDGDHIYVAGLDGSPDLPLPGNNQWRIEKRDKNTGALVTMFEDRSIVDGAYTPSFESGVVQSNLTTGDEVPNAIAVDEAHIYVGGYNWIFGPFGNDQWRIEKRLKDTGALVEAFQDTSVVSEGYIPTNVNGLVQSNPSTNDDQLHAVVADGAHIYLVGADRTHGEGAGRDQWRIEKRLKDTGGLVTEFEDHSIDDGVDTPTPRPGVVQSNPTTGYDRALAAIIDGEHIYAVGADQDTLRIEKRSKATGDLAIEFGDGGVVQSDLSTSYEGGSSVAADDMFLYVAGYENVGIPGRVDHQWRIEKRSKLTGEP
ncbi:hypothetical protein N9917_03350 [Deltaproteobacteria bacterium]|nr:hypothetical protein [Deltaproteobacteria bacterium]